MASTKLTRTPSGAGNKKTFTWSGWVKRSGLGAIQGLFTVDTGSGESAFGFLADDTLRLYLNIASNYPTIVTNQVFRDTSAWYHIAFAVDTTQSTEADRVKIYVNGSQVTSFSSASYPTQNADTDFNTTNPHEIGFYSNQTGGAGYFDGQLAHVHFTDGYAYAASSFGSTATNGQWVPTQTPSVTYGSNGYFLKFTNASDLGEDFSGNNNDFTKSGSGDQVKDNPKNVFATMNPLNITGGTLSNGSLYYSQGANWNNGVTGTQSFSAGKWYWEARVGGNYWFIGIQDVDSEQSADTANGAYKWTYAQNAKKYNNTTYVDYGATYAANDIISVAYDADNGSLTFYKNGSSQGVAYSSLSTSKRYAPFVNAYSSNLTLNFGQNGTFNGTVTAQGNADGNSVGDFYYSPPSGYLALCTDNLSSELTLPIGKGSSYFNTVLYSGTGSSQSITGVGFQPDWVWMKSRNQAYSHQVADIVRGNTKYLSTNSEGAESTATNRITSFDSNGFSLGDAGGSVNGSGNNIVAWNWLGSNTTATNSNGSLTSTVSANQTSGFSVVNYNLNTASVATIGHGLSQAPELIILRGRNSTAAWWAFTTVIDGSLDYIEFSGTGTKADDTLLSLPTSTVFSQVQNYSYQQNCIAYCSHSVEGYSKIGTYAGNNSDNGTFIYLGFRPSFILMKSYTSGENWLIYDNKRDTHNVTDEALLPNSDSASGGSANAMDFLSNGFKLRSSSGSLNGSSQSYLYYAIAENPFVDSSGVPTTAR